MGIGYSFAKDSDEIEWNLRSKISFLLASHDQLANAQPIPQRPEEKEFSTMFKAEKRTRISTFCGCL